MKLSNLPTEVILDHDGCNTQRDFGFPVSGLNVEIAIGGEPGNLTHRRNASPSKSHPESIRLLPISTNLSPNGGSTDVSFVGSTPENHGISIRTKQTQKSPFIAACVGVCELAQHTHHIRFDRSSCIHDNLPVMRERI